LQLIQPKQQKKDNLMDIFSILILVAVGALANLIATPVEPWLRSVFSTASICNDKARNLAEAALFSAIYTTIVTVAAVLLSIPIGLSNIIYCLLLVTVIKYLVHKPSWTTALEHYALDTKNQL
jgi:hypothetical protein